MTRLLTDTLLRGLAVPKTGRIEVTDVKVTGLTFRVTANGAKSWSYRFRDRSSGKLIRSTIGPYPDIGLATARDRALELRKLVLAGVNPIEQRRRNRAEAGQRTFEALAARYIEEYAKRFKKSAKTDERNLRLHILPMWRARRFDEITRADVIELCEAMITAGTPTNANRVQALISKIFAFAIDASLLTNNPCLRLQKRASENAGKRTLNDRELRLFWTHTHSPPVSPAVGLALRIALLTGARAGEVAGMKRDELQRNIRGFDCVWRVPAERSKNGKAHLIPLSSTAARQVGDALALSRVESPYVFPSPTAAHSSITAHALAVAMARMIRAIPGEAAGADTLKCEPPSPHDLRRTFASGISALGIPAEDVAACLNHKRRDVTGLHYDQYERLREKAHAYETWAVSLQSIITAT